MTDWDNRKIFPDSSTLTRYVAERIARLAQATLEHNETFSIALSGGSTPKPIYHLLATEFREALDWERIHLFWGDERCVAPDDPQSNYRMVKEVLIDAIRIPEDNIHRMHGEDDPNQAAMAYEEEILRFFDNPEELFDLNLLGMGDDGHTASLFPGTKAVHEDERLVIAHHIDSLQMSRITLTRVGILRSMNIMFIVSGSKKAQVLREVLSGADDPDRYPSQVIARSNHAHLVWAIDEAAASQLE